MGKFNTGTSLDFDYDKLYNDVLPLSPTKTTVPTVTIRASQSPGSVIGNGTLYDAQNDPRYPISSAYVGGWGTEGMWPVSGVAAPSSGISPELAYSMGQPGKNTGTGPLMAIDAATKPSAPLLGLNFMNDVALRAGGPMAGLSVWDTGSGAVPPDDVGKGVWGRLAMGSGGSQEGMVLGGAPGAVSSPMFHRSDLTGAIPKVAYHSKPITHDRVAPKAAGQRYDVMGRDMAFMPTSVQTSSRWDTGY